nr:hypothetical protein [uncultured Dyadobacter sp.]
MFSSKDYSKMTLEELLSEEKKMKSQKAITAIVIGLLVGVAIYAATHKSFLLPVILLIVSFQIGYRNAQNLKSIQEEISRRNTAQ